MANQTPQIVSAGGMSIAAAPAFLAIPTGLSSATLAPYSFLVAGTGGYEAAVSGDLAITHIVEALFDQNMRNITQQNPSATQLAANPAYVAAYPIAGLTLLLGEDGAGGIIADWTATPYVDVVVGTPLTINANADPTAGARANIQIDSSTASASVTGLPFQIIGTDPSSDAALVPAANPKNYLVVRSSA